MRDTDTLPWYRQFWPWFLIALPASAVIAGLATVYIAVTRPPAMVAGDYYREGLAINHSLRQEKNALTLGISADLHIDSASGVLTLQLQAPDSMDVAPVLQLRFIHPVDAAQDFSVPLQHESALHYRQTIPALVAQRWHLELSAQHTDAAQSWKLHASINLAATDRVSLSANSIE